MRKALVISALAVAVLAGSAAAALQRYDSSRSDEIAEGISVAGVDVGGMTVAEAKVAVRKEVAHRLDQPLRITHRKRSFTVDPALVDVQTNVDALLQSAMDESREGNFLTRSLRDLTGRTEESDLELQVEYSQEAVGRVVAGIRREVQQRARDATSSASFAGVQITPAQLGVALRPRLLRNEIVDHLVSPDSSRTFAVPVRIVRPKVTTKKLKARYDHFIAISRSRRELRLFVNQRLVRPTASASARPGSTRPPGSTRSRAWRPTPPGTSRTASGPATSPARSSPATTRRTRSRRAGWASTTARASMEPADAASIGGAASHGCIRMLIPDVIDLYDRVPLHTPLSIA